jgi:hypothetical protein
MAFGIFYWHLVYFISIWYILWTFCIFCVLVSYILHRFGMLHQEKSGKPVRHQFQIFRRNILDAEGGS